MITLNLPEGYGNVIGVAVGAIPFLSFVHGSFVSHFRKKAAIPYPHAYATQEQCKASPKAYKFNCAQRAHQNFLENQTQVALSILVSGLKYPDATTVLGITWVVMRTLYMIGYIFSNSPAGSGRYLGTPYLFAQAGLWGLAVFGVGWPMMKTIVR